MDRVRGLIGAVAMLAGAWSAPALAKAPAKPIPIKVVVLTTFEVGADTGDAPGEFQHWVERYPLPKTLAVEGVERPVRLSGDGVLGVVTGMRARPRETVAALISGGKFDLSHAYWLVAGIAGVDPRTASIGSAAWARWVVDGDPLYEMDDREIPAGWPWGLYSLGTTEPSRKGSAAGSSDMAWKLDPGLVAWAFGLTRNVEIPDSDALRAARAGYASEPEALKPPHVLLGDALATVRFWHGEKRTAWARDWMGVWTAGQGVFVMSDCEDQGVLDVLTLYGKQGRVDARRVLVLRTGSNYTREADGADPVLRKFAYGGAAAAFDSAYRVGAPVVRALVKDWPRYRDKLPQA
jgi:purine nucleoside permease